LAAFVAVAARSRDFTRATSSSGFKGLRELAFRAEREPRILSILRSLAVSMISGEVLFAYFLTKRKAVISAA
jgi:hypothetical protein